MGHHDPVTDWATDFDHTDEVWAADPYPIWDELRQTCPVAHTERYGGGWLPTRHEDIAAIAYDTERFTSRSVVMSKFRPPRELAPVTLGWREVRIENADDVERVKKWLVDDLGPEVSMLPDGEPLRELGDYFWHAAERIREIRTS